MSQESQSSHALSVSLTRVGGKVDVDMQSAALGCISIDSAVLSPDERAGTAKKFLAASALYCYCAALDKALDARKAEYRKIEATSTLETGTDDKGRGRVTGITLDVTVFMDQEYEFIFERVEKIMKQGCLITASLEAAFPIHYNLQLDCDDE